MTRILIADDHAVVRRGLRQILESEPDMIVVGEAQNASEALGLVRTGDWDLVVLDITMPDRSGLDVLQELKREHPKLPVLILSVHSEDQYAERLLKAGAAGYMTKESAPEVLIHAVRKVLQGGIYVSPLLAEKLALELRVGDKASHEALSGREYQIFVMIAEGKPLKQIADELCISEKTVSTHRARILDKMMLKNNAELIRYALHNGLLD